MKKLFSLFLFTVIAYAYTGLSVFAAYLNANTPVVVQTENLYSSDNLSVGDEVQFRVVNNVAGSNGAVLIRQGALVSAKVVKVNKRGRVGIPGKITVDEFYANAVNGRKVPLSGVIQNNGKSKMGLSIGLSVLIPLFLLMHGEDTQIPQGVQYTLYTAENTQI